MKKLNKFLMAIFIYIITSFVAYGYSQKITVKVEPENNVKLYNIKDRTIFDMGFFNETDVVAGKVFPIATVTVNIEIEGSSGNGDENYDIKGIEVDSDWKLLQESMTLSTEPLQFTENNSSQGELQLIIDETTHLSHDGGSIISNQARFKTTGRESEKFLSSYSYEFVLKAKITGSLNGEMYSFSAKESSAGNYINLRGIIEEQLGKVK